MTVRGLLMWVHLILGLSGAILLAIIGVTGAYITFQGPLQRVFNPVPPIAEFTGRTDLGSMLAVVEREFAPRRVATIDVREREATLVRLENRTLVFVDPRSLQVLGVRHARFASLENLTAVIRRLHTNLLLGPKGRLLVTLATAEALLLALTGLWLWWKKRHWQFTAWRGSIFRVSWDLHNATGIWFVVPVLAMVITGLGLAFPEVVHRIVGAPPAPWLNAPVLERVPPEAARVGMTRALSAADSALPGEPMVRIVIPPGPRGTIAVGTSRHTVYVDPYSGDVIEVRPHRTLSAGAAAVQTVEQLHTGELMGLPGRAIMTLGSLMLAVMSVTGVVLGWKRLVILFATRRGAGRPAAVRPVTRSGDRETSIRPEEAQSPARSSAGRRE